MNNGLSHQLRQLRAGMQAGGVDNGQELNDPK